MFGIKNIHGDIEQEIPDKILKTYILLNDYDSAIKYCDEILKNVKSDNDIQYINNKKAYIKRKIKNN